MIVRSREVVESRRLDDTPEQRRGARPLVRALAERDGRPVGYALYRLAQDGSTPDTWTKTVRVNEAFGVDDGATRDVLAVPARDRLGRPDLGVPPAPRPSAAAPRRPHQQAPALRLGRSLGAGRGRSRRPGRPSLRVAEARHGRDRVRSALPRERGLVDDRGRRSASRHAPPGRSRRRIWPRLDVPRWACRSRSSRGQGSRSKSHGEGSRGRTRLFRTSAAMGAPRPSEGTVIVVTGASGRVGGLVAQELDRRGLRFRAVTRNVERLPDLGGAEIALAGYDEPDTLAGALEPGDRVFMVSMRASGTADRAAQGFHRRVGEARGRADRLPLLRRRGTKRDVRARALARGDRRCCACGVPFSSVRNGMYADARSPRGSTLREGSPARAATAA